MVYLAIESPRKPNEDLYYKGETLNRVVEFVYRKKLTNYVISDMPFYDDDDNLIPETEIFHI